MHLLPDALSDRSDPGRPVVIPVGPVQVGLVVGRSVGNSVVRHRVARQLRHLMRDRLPAFAAGTMLVVRAQPSAAGRSSALLGEDLDRAMLRLGVHA